jgi:hypothetical protein
MAVHHDCADRHARLSEAVRARQVIEWTWYCGAVQRAGLRVDACAEVQP